MKRFILLFIIVSLLFPFFSTTAKDVFITDASLLPTQAQSALAGQTFLLAAEMTDELCILTENEQGLRIVTIFKHTGGTYTLDCTSAPLPAMHGIKPTLRAGYTTLNICYGEEAIYTFSRNYFGGWRLVGISGKSGYRCTRYRLIEPGIGPSRTIAGNGTSAFLDLFDPFQFPPDFALAAAALDINGYALVSNPDPSDRLHLRAAPDIKSVSKGKYYNGTPVYITQDLGNWVKVVLANDDGYMMKQYLTFGADMMAVQTAFPQMIIRDSLAGKDIPVYMRPDSQSGTAGILTDCGAGRAEITILGAIGTDWYHVICGNGLIGYLPVSDFSPGSR